MVDPTLEPQQQKYIPYDNTFYRKYYHFFFYGTMVITFILMSIIGFVFYQMLHRPLPVFFAQQPTNEKMKLTPFTTPNLLPDTILRWAGKAATTAYTFDYVNYNVQLRLARPYFTADGWQIYLRSVEALINTVTQNQLFVNGVVAGTPVISNQGPLPGNSRVWRVQIPFLVTYQSANTSSKKHFIVVMMLVNVPTEVNPQGIGIDQFVMIEK